ncbi:MAG: UDP-N-acetylglucosamine 2-epimerase (non-hydrolyzing) [Planctomycetota bacterium]|nr:UDP-N-acetylglucosamine 2-epimerase (non-hydrolyzing) [Planctomycetota bacterium]
MLKVLTIVGTRPELIKMCRVIDRFDRHTRHVLVHTGQNYDYELNQVFFENLGIRRPDHFLDAAGGSAAATIARVVERADETLAAEAPDAMLVYGDTNSALAVLSAKRRKIPIFHMEAGNRCFDQRVPEELNRKVVDHLSDINITITEHARRYLLAEGLPADRVFVLGSHLPEVFDTFRDQIAAAAVLERLGLQPRGYFLVSAHREENVDDPARLAMLLDALNGLADAEAKPVLVSTHPRTRARLEALEGVAIDPRVRFEKPFGFFDYVKLQMQAACVLSDSGTITEESAILGFPAVTIRDTHERPEGMDEGVLVMCGLGRASVLPAVRLAMAAAGEQAAARVPAYQGSDVSWKVLKLVTSYVPYVRERVWGLPPARG